MVVGRQPVTLGPVIVVIGSPVFARDGDAPGREVAGLAGGVALAAAAADRAVQLVGKVGDDDAGDALVIALARGGVGHAALLRDASHATPTVSSPDLPIGDTIEESLLGDHADPPRAPGPTFGLPLEAADIELALRYLTDFRVVVIAAALDPLSVRATLDAAGFASAHVVRLEAPGQAPAGDSPDGVEITALEAPEHGQAAFATLVGNYAAGLDAGRSPRDAFAEATRATHWERASLE
jgi:hypothetical protein